MHGNFLATLLMGELKPQVPNFYTGEDQGTWLNATPASCAANI